jgi:hypothetical protein
MLRDGERIGRLRAAADRVTGLTYEEPRLGRSDDLLADFRRQFADLLC